MTGPLPPCPGRLTSARRAPGSLASGTRRNGRRTGRTHNSLAPEIRTHTRGLSLYYSTIGLQVKPHSPAESQAKLEARISKSETNPGPQCPKRRKTSPGSSFETTKVTKAPARPPAATKECPHTKAQRSQRRALRKWVSTFVALWLRVRTKYLSCKGLHRVKNLRKKTRFERVVVRRKTRSRQGKLCPPIPYSPAATRATEGPGGKRRDARMSLRGAQRRGNLNPTLLRDRRGHEGQRAYVSRR
jgi:hypothetical protein